MTERKNYLYIKTAAYFFSIKDYVLALNGLKLFRDWHLERDPQGWNYKTASRLLELWRLQNYDNF